MRFTERELTLAVQGAAKTVLAAQDKAVRKGRRDVETAWNGLEAMERWTLLNAVGDQVLPVLIALPDVDVAPGTPPSFADADVTAAVEERLAEVSGLKRRALLAARLALVRAALASLPPRADPEALIVPDHL